MERKDLIDYWISTSLEDLNSAQIIFSSGRYDWALFVAHLSLEKLLKAIWIRDNDSKYPPRIHELNRLAKETKLGLNAADQTFLIEVSSFNLEARYPDYKKEFQKKCTKEFSEEYMNKIIRFHECLLKQMQ